MNNHDRQEQSKEQEAKTQFFFPNVDEGLAFSVEANSQQEAEEANTKYLAENKKGQK